MMADEERGRLLPIKMDATDSVPFVIKKDKLLIGRADSCEIRIYVDGVAPEHCVITFNEEGKGFVEPGKKFALLFLNGHMIEGKVSLEHKDVITVVKRGFRFFYPTATKVFLASQPAVSNEEIMKSKSETVKVVVRVRPMSDKEKVAGYHSVISVYPFDGAIELHNRKGHPSKKYFTFDAVYDCGAQIEIYDEVFRPLVDSVIAGFNGTIFAYGQTGAGKTYTMEGVIGDPEHEGVIQNSFKHIFNHIARSENTQFLVSASYLEIYQENVRDLLAPDPKKILEVREMKNTGVYVKNLTVSVCKTIEDLQKVMIDGKHNRSIGATNMNVHSSRSHAIFSISVESCESNVEGNQHVKIGKLNLVDLAGSEQQSKTGAVGSTENESIKIKLSLSALVNVISALVDGKSTHVPYRDSKLTRLLQDSLGGNAKTIMIANVGPANYNYEETMTTLRYASRAKNIKNKPVVNIDPKDAILLKYKEEISRLKAQLALKEAKKKKKKDKTEGDKTTEADVIEKMEPESVEIVRKMEHLLEEERVAYLNESNLMTEEKEKILANIKAKDEELRLENEAEKIERQLHELEEKLLCGGKNIIDRTNEQERMLEKKRQELAQQKMIEREINKKLVEEEFTTWKEKETYKTLNEECEIKTKELEEFSQRLEEIKDDINEEKEIYSFERREREMTIEELTRGIKLTNLVIDNFINPEEKAKLLENVKYDEDENDWVIYSPTAGQSHYNTAERPVSAIPTCRRPTSSHALILANLISDPRYKSENITDADLAISHERTSDIEPSLLAVQGDIKKVVADDMFSVNAFRRTDAFDRSQRSLRSCSTPGNLNRTREKREYPVPRGLVPKSKTSSKQRSSVPVLPDISGHSKVSVRPKIFSSGHSTIPVLPEISSSGHSTVPVLPEMSVSRKKEKKRKEKKRSTTF